MHHLSNGELALAALVLEAAIGYPHCVYRAIGHPVTWVGAPVAWLEARLNRPSAPEWQRRALGVLTLAVLLSASAFGAFAFDRVLPDGPFGSGILILAASSLLAQRSLHQHVRAVAEALKTNGLKPAAQPWR